VFGDFADVQQTVVPGKSSRRRKFRETNNFAEIGFADFGAAVTSRTICKAASPPAPLVAKMWTVPSSGRQS